jgi:hypothetical protein
MWEFWIEERNSITRKRNLDSEQRDELYFVIDFKYLLMGL